MSANCYSNNVNMFIVYSYRYALNLFEDLFYFLYTYKRIQRKMCGCVVARITKSSFSKVFLITAKSNFSKVFWIKAVKVIKSTGDKHAEKLFQQCCYTALLKKLFYMVVSCRFAASLYYQKIIKNTQERHVFRTSFVALNFLNEGYLFTDTK